MNPTWRALDLVSPVVVGTAVYSGDGGSVGEQVGGASTEGTERAGE